MKNIYCVIYKSLEKDGLNCNKPIEVQEVLGKKMVSYVEGLAESVNCKKIFYFEEPVDIEPESYILLLDVYKPFLKLEDLNSLVGADADIATITDGTNSGVYLIKAELYSGPDTEKYFNESLKIIVGAVTQFVPLSNKYLILQAANELRARVNMGFIENGVTIIDPNSVYISTDAKIGCDTVIYPNVFIEGSTIIGEDCVIRANSRIVNSTIANGAIIDQSIILDSQIGEKTTVGPFAYIRPNTVVGEQCRIGDYVELKNSTVGNKTKIPHLTYIGDADVGSGTNIGCGTVTVNYDGTCKHRTVIKDNTFIGCNTNLVAPVEVGVNAYTAAGSTITDNIPEGTLAIARARQVIKAGWKRPQK
ncbi:MAG: hypothetical protein LBV08_04545 [Clostridiales bacterium]|jgi:acyl-[acyl carrier protein]--UDP-N-acetylglucosamine O-acyltransferase|nr:hypothetical protein [Clostridiales bacterium]